MLLMLVVLKVLVVTLTAGSVVLVELSLLVFSARMSTWAAHVVVVLSQGATTESYTVHVEPLVAATVALHPVYFFACLIKNIIDIIFFETVSLVDMC